MFRDPGEAVFVMLGEQKELAAYPNLRRELLRRTVEAAANDPRPPIPHDEVMAELDARLAASRPPVAAWGASVTRPAAADSAGSPGK